MKKEQKVEDFVQLGILFKALSEDLPWSEANSGLSESEYQECIDMIALEERYNGWFTPESVKLALSSWSKSLTENSLNAWLQKEDIYFEKVDSSKRVALILAGNIPLVGFHDVLSCLLSGCKAVIKCSSDDARLIPAFLNILRLWNKDWENEFRFSTAKLENFDAVIATGSNNSSRYFDQYFGKYPNIIRKSRTSVAIIDGTESDDELKNLADDVFQYFGLGCRNVTKLYFPEGYDLDIFFGAIFHKSDVANNNKYSNNYDYHKAIWLLNDEALLDNEFLLLKEDEALVSPVGTVFYEFYNDIDKLKANLRSLTDEIQCIVSKDEIPFGQAQNPSLTDYADGVNTIQFLSEL